ncbi:hypothetical protein OV079_21390 [Nannocystis pusilla]|uniref:Uncharacterized protein n=1 Tax=Nannocystis pusilla TaxID=889268 RepID=A0A9X3EPZ2_9BACT|nr:hypothetical protein [Nannocystis pusilla]MCY1008063.1 hypothetical protein [Nannocystis pusilla]
MSATPPPASPTPELEPDAAAMRALVAAAMERIAAHIEALPAMPACDVEDGAGLARSLREALPDRGSPSNMSSRFCSIGQSRAASTPRVPATWPTSPAAGCSWRRWPT